MSRIMRLPRETKATRLAVAALASLVAISVAACGQAAASRSPTPPPAAIGDCVEVTGPDDDVTVTVVDCPDGDYRVIDLIEYYQDRECPAETEVEIQTSVSFGRPAATGRITTRTMCLQGIQPGASVAVPGSEATAEPTR